MHRASIAIQPAIHAALRELVDYAGLFPPAALEMTDAAAEYERARAGPYAWMLGRFVLPASRLAENAAFAAGCSISAIVDTASEWRDWFQAASARLAELCVSRAAGARVESLEVPLPAPASRRETYDAAIAQVGALLETMGLRAVPAYVELPRNERWGELLASAMTAAARAKLGAKLRCGGTTAAAFPSIEEVAAFVREAVAADVPFKATAGLHHPIRHRDGASGFEMHGFLNVLAASAFADRLSNDDLERVVAEEDPAAFALDAQSLRWRDYSIGVADLERVRERRFVAYGSCSFEEPVRDLIALGMLSTR